MPRPSRLPDCVCTQQGNDEEALNLFSAALNLNPKLCSAYCSMGDIYKRQNRLREAKAYYLAAVKVDSTFHVAWHNLASVFESENDLSNAAHVSCFSCFEQACWALKSADHALCWQCYQQTIKIKPDCSEAHCNLGNVQKHLGNTPEAQAHYQSALAYDPNMSVACNNLGSVHYEMGNLKEAERLFHQVLPSKCTPPSLCPRWSH